MVINKPSFWAEYTGKRAEMATNRRLPFCQPVVSKGVKALGCKGFAAYKYCSREGTDRQERRDGVRFENFVQFAEKSLYRTKNFCYHVLDSDPARHSTFCRVWTKYKEEYRLTSGAAVWRPVVKRRS